MLEVLVSIHMKDEVHMAAIHMKDEDRMLVGVAVTRMDSVMTVWIRMMVVHKKGAIKKKIRK